MQRVNEDQIDRWLEKAREIGILDQLGKNDDFLKASGVEELLYHSSVNKYEDCTFCLLKQRVRPLLGIFGACIDSFGFEGTTREIEANTKALFCPLNHTNAVALRNAFNFTAPSTLRDCRTTFGFGDRLGLAGSGHIRGVVSFDVAPVLAQLSVRELNLMNRTHEDLLDTATWFVFQEGYRLPWGADGDHLKAEKWVRTAISLGFTMITADVSDYFKSEFDRMPEPEIRQAYRGINSEAKFLIEKTYLNKTIDLDTGEKISFSEIELARLFLIYWEALEHTETLYRAAIDQKGDENFDFELSIDEVDRPTTAQAHTFVACELERRNIKVFSVAPRFVGEFQKGIDYIGDIANFERTFKIHAAIARKFGYKISIHSGSDKFSVYPIIGRYTQGIVHVKTAGTYWLEAARLVACEDPALYRRIHSRALQLFDRAQQYYHVTTDLQSIPELSEVKDEDLPLLFENPHARQLVHISYGEIFSDSDLRTKFFEFMINHIEDYWEAVKQHVEKHCRRLELE